MLVVSKLMLILAHGEGFRQVRVLADARGVLLLAGDPGVPRNGFHPLKLIAN